MALKPWYTVIQPREDLREGKPLDASEFAVHLDQVRDGRAPKVYQKPEEFFDRTYLTQNLTGLAAEVIRRLSGIKTEANAVFNLATQFGGGKTHALTLLYHLAKNGSAADGWRGVRKLIERAEIKSVPKAEVAIFVGTEFDSITGRGGTDGTPLRRTPWGEIAFQLGGAEAFQAVAEHEQQLTAPAGDVIRQFLPKDKPCLILMDELMNYISRNRKSGLGSQLYNFLQNLSEEARGHDNVVLAVSIPDSELEMSAEDQQDYMRFRKLLDRLGKAVMMSSEGESSEIIRRRLFEWDEQAVSNEGKILLNREATQTCKIYADWMVEQRSQLPAWFPTDNARLAFEATYPFHPVVLSVFERKWQALPRFQQTRGMLRLLALWVSRAYQEGYQGAHRDQLIGLGTAPLDDPIFRAAAFEQLGESKLEAAVTTDICGKNDAFAVRLDKEATDAIKKARLHRKVATAIFFESNGGQARGEATIPEIRLAVAEPSLEIGNVETVLETLTESCYFLAVERNRYRISLSPNLNKLLADRRANINAGKIAERIRSEVQKAFATGAGVDRIYFPEKSNQIPDRPALTLAVLPPEQSFEDKPKTLALIEAMTRENGTSARTFKSAIIWVVPEGVTALVEDARKLLAWEDIADEIDSGTLKLDDGQQKQLDENLKKAGRDLKEGIWRSYKNLVLLGKDNILREIDLGLVHSSAADSMLTLILNRLRQDGDVEKEISPNFLVRNWPPAFKEWSTKSVRDAFFASPQFPRLLNAEAVKEAIARGVGGGVIAYVGKPSDGEYQPFTFGGTMSVSEVEISDEVFIIKKETAEAYRKAKASPAQTIDIPDSGSSPASVVAPSPEKSTLPQDQTPSPQPKPQPAPATKLTWIGDIPPQKWTTFYTKVLTKFATGKGLRLTLSLNVNAEDGLSAQKIEETKAALLELGLNDKIDVE
ncbi:MAG: ATP-binding protein [Blastocatellia bacterium]